MRTLTSTIEAQLAAGAIVPRILVRRHLDSGLILRTNHSSDITFNGEVYDSMPLEVGAITSYLANKVDATSVKFGNADGGESSILTYEDVVGRKIEIWEIFLNATTLAVVGGANDKIILFPGRMHEPEDPEDSAVVSVRSLFDRGKTYYPTRRFGVRCNNRFCDTRQYRGCRYNGSTQPRGTADSGTSAGLTDSALVGISSMFGAQVKMLSGDNTTIMRYVLTHNTGSGQITFDAMPHAVSAGDQYLLDCDKSRSSCAGFNNLARFDGYDDLLLGWEATSTPGGLSPLHAVLILGPTASALDNESRMVPLAYGTVRVKGVLIKGAQNGDFHTRVYGFLAGPVSSISSIIINGRSVTPESSAMVIRFGGDNAPVTLASFGSGLVWEFAAGDSFSWPGLCFIVFRDYTPRGEGYSPTDIAGRSQNYFTSSPESDVVELVLSAKTVKHYDSAGNASAENFAGTNPIWGLVDYYLNEADQPLAASDLDWPIIAAAAAACAPLGYLFGIVIEKQDDEPLVVDKFLSACRGYLYSPGGKLAIAVEQIWQGAPAFAFGDGYNGSARNIVGGKIRPYKKHSDDAPNRVIVKYRDASIRESGAELNAAITAGQTNIVVKNTYGTLAAAGGTCYLGSESFTYAAFNGTTLTGCSARASAYPANQPLYQGTQLFPERTAAWNDYDNQDDTGRIIPLEIDAPGIQSYVQAYRIAEYHGEKNTRGNLLVDLRGGPSSKKLTVGDVVSITGGPRQWVAWLFRAIKAIEKPTEAVQDYTLELYHEGFYAENTPVPPIPYITKLPPPFAPLNPATDLAVVEEPGAFFNAAYKAILKLTYTLPAAGIFWDYAEIYIKRAGAAAWTLYNGFDYSRGTGFKIESGFVIDELLSIKVVSVSTQQVRSDFASSPTVDFIPTNIFVAGVTDMWQEVIDNNIQIGWTGVPGRYPIDKYEVRVGDVYSSAEVLGTTSSTFKTYFVKVAGTYKYWITPIDTNGAYGTPGSITAIMNQPPDFVLHAQFHDAFAGTKTNIIYDSGDNVFYACANTSQTFDQYSATLGGTTMQNFIDAATYLIEPMATSASYEEVYDSGAVIPFSMINVALDRVFLQGSMTIVCTISTSATGAGGSWTVLPDGWEGAGINFRYVKVHLAFAATATDIVALNYLDVTLFVKEQHETGKGTITNANAGLVVVFKKTWADINNVDARPFGTGIPFDDTAIADFVDVPNPTQMTVYRFNGSGTKITGDVSWDIDGI